MSTAKEYRIAKRTDKAVTIRFGRNAVLAYYREHGDTVFLPEWMVGARVAFEGKNATIVGRSIIGDCLYQIILQF